MSKKLAKFHKPGYMSEFTADKDFLNRIKCVYQVLQHLTQPEIESELYQQGQEYSIEANKHNYTNKDAVKEFLKCYEHGFLSRDAVYSAYYPRHLEETVAVFKLFYYTKDFDTFFKTALFCRNRLNPDMFAYAFIVAVMHRPDTEYMKMPALYEVMPNFFFSDELLEKARQFKEFGKFEANSSAGYDAYVIPYNASNYYLKDEDDKEKCLSYFTEDVGLTSFYFYWHHQYPFFMRSEEFGWPKNYRGIEYLYGHKYMYSRYHLERLSNDLDEVEDYSFNSELRHGYQPSLTYSNGQKFPSRDANSAFLEKDYERIREIEAYESRILQAIDSGFVLTEDGEKVNIFTLLGLDVVGSMVEGNVDSCNPKYYGSMDHTSRKVLGFSKDPLVSGEVFPSALEQFCASLRDPVSWRLAKRILSFYHRYKSNLKPYEPEEIQFPELKIESVTVDKIVTYFDYSNVTISRGLTVANKKDAESHVIQARQCRLNHKDFTFNIDITAEKAMKAIVRIFIGPKSNARNENVDFRYRFQYFYELNIGTYDLSAGKNRIVHDFHDLFFTIDDPEPSEVFYKRILNALEGKEELKFQKRLYGFPQRILLPKGKPDGFPVQFFVHAAPVTATMYFSTRVLGDCELDMQPFGYPLDKPINDYIFKGPNFYFKDVLIYHEDVKPDQHVEH